RLPVASAALYQPSLSLLSAVAPYANASWFFFYETATPVLYTLSLHDALPILSRSRRADPGVAAGGRAIDRYDRRVSRGDRRGFRDRKSTRLNSSHQIISYAVFCLKKKKTQSIKPLTSTAVHSPVSTLLEFLIH